MENRYVLLLGSNVGDRLKILSNARQELARVIGHIISVSHVYETEAWGGIAQKAFLNQVLIIYSLLDPFAVLEKILMIEQENGRVRKERWSSRTLDIDILYFNKDIIQTEFLVIPHPELHKRRFTLKPLVEVDPDYVHPLLQLQNSQLLANCQDFLPVKIIEA